MLVTFNNYANYHNQLDKCTVHMTFQIFVAPFVKCVDPDQLASDEAS